MKRVNPRSPWIPKNALPLSLWSKKLDKNVVIDPLEKPLSPVMSVNDTTLVIKSVTQVSRLVYLLPQVFIAWLVVCLSFQILYPTSIDTIEKGYNEGISGLKSQYGDDYFENSNDEVVLTYYNTVGEDGKMSFSEYYDYRISGGGLTPLIVKAIVFVLATIWALCITYYLIFIPRQAYFYFDRIKQIVYTWHKGKVMACSFDKLGILESKLGLMLFMYAESGKPGEYSYLTKFVQPTDKAYFNTQEDNTNFLALIVKYMKYGKKSVLIGNEYETKQYLFFREDPKPNDFERRLAKVLEHEHELVNIYEKNLGRQVKPDGSFSNLLRKD